jgi:hypothetical protein
MKGGITFFKMSDSEKQKLIDTKKKVSLGISKMKNSLSNKLSDSKKTFLTWKQDQSDNKAAKALLNSKRNTDLYNYTQLVKQQRQPQIIQTPQLPPQGPPQGPLNRKDYYNQQILLESQKAFPKKGGSKKKLSKSRSRKRRTMSKKKRSKNNKSRRRH